MRKRKAILIISLVAMLGAVSWSFIYLSRPVPIPLGGFIDKTGHMVISPRFQLAGPFAEGLAAVQIDGKWGYINKSGCIIIKPRFESAGKFIDGMAVVGYSKDTFGENNLGYINKSGKLVVKPQFCQAGEFHDGLARISYLTDCWVGPQGYIDKTGKFAIQPVFCYTTDFKDGFAIVEKNGENSKRHYIDTSGKATESLDMCDTLSEGHVLHYDSRINRAGYFNKAHKPVIPSLYLWARPFCEGRAAVSLNGSTWGFIDKTGQWVLRPKFKAVNDFSDGMAKIYMHRKFGFIDREGHIAIPPRLESVQDFHDGLAIVWSKNHKCGYIDKSGKSAIPIRYYDAGEFSEGLAFVRTEPVKGYGTFFCDHSAFEIQTRISNIRWRLHGLIVNE